MDIDHLDGGELLEGSTRCQPRCQSMQATLQCDLQTVGQEGKEDMSFDPTLILVEDRPYRQIAFQVLQRLFNGDELGIVLPQQRALRVVGRAAASGG